MKRSQSQVSGSRTWETNGRVTNHFVPRKFTWPDWEITNPKSASRPRSYNHFSNEQVNPTFPDYCNSRYLRNISALGDDQKLGPKTSNVNGLVRSGTHQHASFRYIIHSHHTQKRSHETKACFWRILLLQRPTNIRLCFSNACFLYTGSFQGHGEIKLAHLQLMLLQCIRPTGSASQTVVVVIDSEVDTFTAFKLIRMLGLV